ncbi:hypothetical protein L897_00735 [Streptococcus pyogenes HSC5]|nr:hypothetical protein L897_00735 [Streptococcus pyogenes HSC5]
MIKHKLVNKNSRALRMRKDSSLAKSKDNGVIRRTFHFRLISDFYRVVKLIINHT